MPADLVGGAFCVYHGRKPGEDTPFLIIIERGKYNGTTPEGFGVPGGLVDLSLHEFPVDAAVRELEEEIVHPDGSPVLSIPSDRLRLEATGIDYKGNYEGVPVLWLGYSCPLTDAEIDAIRDHAAAATDPGYAAACRGQCHNEVFNILLLAPGEVLQREARGDLNFRYSHEQRLVATIARSLLETV